MNKPAGTPSSSKNITGAWESEGGSLAPQATAELPAGVVVKTVTHYQVGSYTYTNLDDAMAQYRRQQHK